MNRPFIRTAGYDPRGVNGDERWNKWLADQHALQGLNAVEKRVADEIVAARPASRPIRRKTRIAVRVVVTVDVDAYNREYGSADPIDVVREDIRARVTEAANVAFQPFDWASVR